MDQFCVCVGICVLYYNKRLNLKNRKVYAKIRNLIAELKNSQRGWVIKLKDDPRQKNKQKQRWKRGEKNI